MNDKIHDRSTSASVRHSQYDLPSSDDVLRASSATAEDATCTLRDLQTRFLYPFFFDRNRVTKAASALLAERFAHRDGLSLALWHCEQPSDLYCDELLDHARDFLFGQTNDVATGECRLPALDSEVGQSDAAISSCRYLKISTDAVQSWFRQTSLPSSRAKEKPSSPDAAGSDSSVKPRESLSVALVPDARIELFLSSFGVGAISIALTPGNDHLAINDASDFNYRLAQFRRHDLAKIRKAHPHDDEAAWNRIPTEQRSAIKPVPGEKSPLSDRLGVPGGMFDLSELLGWLLSPLTRFGLLAIQNELSVYSVARFGSDVDFENVDRRGRFGVFLTGLAQVEESRHAGAASDSLGVSNGLLNRLHWAAVGQLGAAHLIADQASPASVGSGIMAEAKEHPFSGSKTAIIRDKYFIPYLVALLQRLVLNRVIRESMHDPENLASLRDDILTFAVRGHFTQVSSRHSLDRFYRLARTGMNIQDAWTEVRRAISDLDAKNTADRQEKVAARQEDLARSAADNLRVIAHVQTMVEYIEIFMVSAYAAHMFNMLFEGKGHFLLAGHLPWLGVNLSAWLQTWQEEIRTAGTAITAIVAGFITWLLISPKRQHGKK